MVSGANVTWFQVLKKRVRVNEHPDLLAAGVSNDEVQDTKQLLHELLDNYRLE